MTIKSNVSELVNRLNILTGRKWTQTEIHDATGINLNTVRSWMLGYVTRFDAPTMAAWLTFFAAHGMPVTVGDLFTVD